MTTKFGKIGAAKEVKVHALSLGKRFLEPTEVQIKAMMKSFKEVGQTTPIIVTPVTHNTYRIVTGATRYKAASELHWKTLRAEILHGSATDCLIHELTENLDRKNLTAKQRKAIRAERRRLIAETVAETPPSKGGRGKKGGASEAARQMNVSEPTARRAAKPRQKIGSDEVSVSEPDAHVPPSMNGTGLTKLAITWSTIEDARFERYRQSIGGGERSGLAKRIINDFLCTWEKERAA